MGWFILICIYGLCESPSAAHVYDAFVAAVYLFFAETNSHYISLLDALAFQPGQSARTAFTIALRKECFAAL